MISEARKNELTTKLTEIDSKLAEELQNDAHDFGATAADRANRATGETFDGLTNGNSTEYMRTYFAAYWGRLEANMIRRNLVEGTLPGQHYPEQPKQKQTFKIPVTYQMVGNYHIEAESLEEAEKQVFGDIGLPDDAEYLVDSMEITSDD
jgi:hypothetical protein